MDDLGKKIKLEEFQEVLKSFKQKAPGWPNITKINIKNAPPNIIQDIIDAFKAALNIDYFPDLFKVVKLTFIPKPGKPSNLVENFRIISLLKII